MDKNTNVTRLIQEYESLSFRDQLLFRKKLQQSDNDYRKLAIEETVELYDKLIKMGIFSEVWLKEQLLRGM